MTPILVGSIYVLKAEFVPRFGQHTSTVLELVGDDRVKISTVTPYGINEDEGSIDGFLEFYTPLVEIEDDGSEEL